MLRWKMENSRSWTADDTLVQLSYRITKEDEGKQPFRIRIETGTKHEEAVYKSFEEASAFAEGFSRCYASSTWRR